MKKWMMIAAVLALAGSLFTGCIGAFGLTTKLYDWNIGVGSKWAAEGVYLIFGVILPVYGVTVAVDALVLNSIEFWSGTNPVTNKKSVLKVGDSRTIRSQDGSVAVLTGRPDGAIDVKIKAPDGAGKEFKLVKEADAVQAVDENGKVLARADSEGHLTH